MLIDSLMGTNKNDLFLYQLCVKYVKIVYLNNKI